MLLLCAAGFCRADVLTFQFWHDDHGVSNYSPGTSYVFHTSKPPSGYGITAYGYSFTDQNLLGTGLAEALYIKNGGGGEQGLGLNNSDADKEVHYNELVQLNVASVRAALGNNVTVTIDSVQTGEGYRLFSSATTGAAGTDIHDFLSTHDGEVRQTYNLTLTQDYLGLSAIYDGSTNGDVLLTQITFSPTVVPEPSSLVVIGIGGLLVTWQLKKRRLR